MFVVNEVHSKVKKKCWEKKKIKHVLLATTCNALYMWFYFETETRDNFGMTDKKQLEGRIM